MNKLDSPIEMGAIRTAAVLQWLVGLGFGIPSVFGIRNLAAGRGILYFIGFPAYGKGPFERIGVQTTVPLLSAFLVICLLECIAASLLWSGARAGAVLSLVLLLFGAVFWWGFALPFPPIFAIAWTTLIVLNWQQVG